MQDDIGKILGRVTRNLQGSNNQGACRLLAAMYLIGNKGAESVRPEQLEDLSFAKTRIIEAIDDLSRRGLVADASTFDGLSWILTHRGRYYAEGLIEEAQK